MFEDQKEEGELQQSPKLSEFELSLTEDEFDSFEIRKPKVASKSTIVDKSATREKNGRSHHQKHDRQSSRHHKKHSRHRNHRTDEGSHFDMKSYRDRDRERGRDRNRDRDRKHDYVDDSRSRSRYKSGYNDSLSSRKDYYRDHHRAERDRDYYQYSDYNQSDLGYNSYGRHSSHKRKYDKVDNHDHQDENAVEPVSHKKKSHKKHKRKSSSSKHVDDKHKKKSSKRKLPSNDEDSHHESKKKIKSEHVTNIKLKKDNLKKKIAKSRASNSSSSASEEETTSSSSSSSSTSSSSSSSSGSSTVTKSGSGHIEKKASVPNDDDEYMPKVVLTDEEDENGTGEDEDKTPKKLLQMTKSTTITNNSNSDSDSGVSPKQKCTFYYPSFQGCRSVESYSCLNRIAEGTYGIVYRAKDRVTEEIVALKRLKMENEKEGFPITSLREVNTLLKGQHPNIVTVREIVVGSSMDKIFIVMDYVEHDLKSLMETMRRKKQVFMQGEVKCLLKQLLDAIAHLHDNWILHRDLKTSNLLLSHQGVLKVGDFGLAREYGSPLKDYTPVVVTLWYRAPELLLCSKTYSTAIDVWSIGCIFAEFLSMQPLFPGKTEIDQINRIFKDLGTPNERIWPGYSKLPFVEKVKFINNGKPQIRPRMISVTSDLGFDLLLKLLTYDPKQRLSAESAKSHKYFEEQPVAIDPDMFPTWPAKSELCVTKEGAVVGSKQSSGGDDRKVQKVESDIYQGFHMKPANSYLMGQSAGFSLKFQPYK